MPLAPEPSATIAPFVTLIIWFCLGIGMGFVSANMAKKRGFLPDMAFFAGFIGSILTVFLLAMVPVKKSEQKEEKK